MPNGMIIITDGDKSLTQFAIDVNGKKGPNIWGQDIFTLAVTASNITEDGSVKDITILPPSSCLPGSDGKNGAKSSAVLFKEIFNYK